jgi:hypothetical protein
MAPCSCLRAALSGRVGAITLFISVQLLQGGDQLILHIHQSILAILKRRFINGRVLIDQAHEVGWDVLKILGEVVLQDFADGENPVIRHLRISEVQV